MRHLQIRTSGKTITLFKQVLVMISLLLMVIPAIVSGSGLIASPAVQRVLWTTFFCGLGLLATLALALWLLSRYSPVKPLKIRKKLILFTRMFLRSEEDGVLRHSVRWQYSVENGKIMVILYPNGLEKDTAEIGRKLSEYLWMPLLKYEESDGKAC